MTHFLDLMEIRFPRLKEVEFTRNSNDAYSLEDTPAGSVEVLYFYERKDFENAVIALAYKLEPTTIPASMGATYIGGLLDHLTGKTISMIILSRGDYSAIPADMASQAIGTELSESDWEDKSLTIRKNHELAHFIQRKMFLENKDALRDEIKADMTGLIAAFGYYETRLAKLFLGLEGPQYREGGRLQNYLAEGQTISELEPMARAYLQQVDDFVRDSDAQEPFDVLIQLETAEKNLIGK